MLQRVKTVVNYMCFYMSDKLFLFILCTKIHQGNRLTWMSQFLCSERYNGDMDRTIEKSVSGDSTYSIDIVGLSGEEGDIQQVPALPQHQAVFVAL